MIEAGAGCAKAAGVPWHIHLAEEQYQVDLSLERFGARPLHAIAALPGDDRPDPRLASASTMPRDKLGLLDGFFLSDSGTGWFSWGKSVDPVQFARADDGGSVYSQHMLGIVGPPAVANQRDAFWRGGHRPPTRLSRCFAELRRVHRIPLPPS